MMSLNMRKKGIGLVTWIEVEDVCVCEVVFWRQIKWAKDAIYDKTELRGGELPPPFGGSQMLIH